MNFFIITNITELQKFDHEYETLSQRSKNILTDIEIYDYNDLKNLYLNNNGRINFRQFRNVGIKSEKELKHFIENIFADFKIPEFEQNNTITKNKTFDNRMNLLFDITFKRLSVRTQNILRVSDTNTLQKFYNTVIIDYDPKKLKRFRNCGKKSISEIINFKSNVDKIINSNNYTSEHVGLLADFKLYLNEGNFFNKKELVIFERYFGFFRNQKKYTLQEIADSLYLSRERVRQISNKIIPKIINLSNLLSLQSSWDLDKYFHGNYFIIDDQYVEKLNLEENTNFSKRLIQLLLGSIKRNEFSFFNIQHNKLHNTGVFYRSNLPINVQDCLYYIQKQLKLSRRKKDIELKFDGLVDQFGKFENITIENLESSKMEIKYHLVSIIKLFYQCQTKYSKYIKIENEYLIIKRTTKMFKYEYIEEVLKFYNKPMHFSDIYDRLIEEGVKIESQTSTHSAMINHPEIFGIKGPGIYGLVSWGGYFGKIGDVAEKILEDRNEPILKNELEEILSRELYISQDSIKEVLFHYEKEDRFIKLNNNTIALKKWYK